VLASVALADLVLDLLLLSKFRFRKRCSNLSVDDFLGEVEQAGVVPVMIRSFRVCECKWHFAVCAVTFRSCSLGDPFLDFG
jgi:hypothetical protein